MHSLIHTSVFTYQYIQRTKYNTLKLQRERVNHSTKIPQILQVLNKSCLGKNRAKFYHA